MRCCNGVVPAIYLNDESLLKADKVHNVWAKRVLATEPIAESLPSA